MQVPNGATKEVSVGFTWSCEGLDCNTKPAEELSEDRQEESTNSAGERQDSNSQEVSSSDAADDDRPEHLKWQGKQASFMRSNEHSRERAGRWDASGLEGAAKSVVQGDEKGAK